MILAPIVLFVYNRPEHTRLTLEALRNNTLAAQSDLFIFSDASKSEVHINSVREVRQYVGQVDGFKSIKIIEREVNFGLAKSIVEGVTLLCNQYGNVIVLEDDIVTSPYFLQYMNDALEYYKDEECVMHVSGYMFPVESAGLAETFFLRTASCWGWATWDRAWVHFEKDPQALIESFSQSTIKRFNMDGTYDFWTQVLKNQAKEINTWAVFWYASVFQKQGLCLHPAASMTVNIGIDGTGIHCGPTSTFNVLLAHKQIVEFNANLLEDSAALKNTKDFFTSLNPSFWIRAYQKLKSCFKL
jgi:GT2 family glycosyltransferase